MKRLLFLTPMFLAACYAEELANGERSGTPATSNLDCKTLCVIAAGAGAFNQASLPTDSSATVFLARMKLTGEAGGEIAVRLVGIVGVLDGTVIAEIGTQVLTIPLATLAERPQVIYRFATDGEVEVRYALSRGSRVRLGNEPAFLQIVTRATVLERRSPWPASISESPQVTANATSADECAFNAPGTYCGTAVAISPYYAPDNFVGNGFQSDPGTGASRTITISFSNPVYRFTVTVHDPDFVGNRVVAYNGAGQEVASATVTGDGIPQSYTNQTVTVTARDIRRIDLVSAPADYVAYNAATFVVDNCATGDSLLDLKVTRDSLRTLWDLSKADSAPPVRIERGLYLFRLRSTGEYFVRISPVAPSDNPCSTLNSQPFPVGWPTGDTVFAAAAHTHPFSHLDILPANCGLPAGAKYDAKNWGGPSDDDINHAVSDHANLGTQSSYVMDKDNIYLIPAGTTVPNWQPSSIKAYPRVDPQYNCTRP